MKYILRIVGFIIIVAMLGLDIVRGQPFVIGPLQVFGSSLGLVIIGLSFLKLNVVRLLIFSGVTVVITIMILELLLIVIGYTPVYYNEPIPDYNDEWICDDELGCRWDYEVLQSTCADYVQTTAYIKRECFVNEAGYFDDDEFISSFDSEEVDQRILFLGDSFTFGLSADLEQSFVEQVEAQLQEIYDVQVWNTGIPGSATRQSLATARKYMPTLKPQIVILGFYLGNDFLDDLFPVDSVSMLYLDNANYISIKRHSFDDALSPVLITDTAAYYRARGIIPPQNDFMRLIGSTRIGTIILRPVIREGAIAKQLDSMKKDVQLELLGELKELTDSYESEFIVLIIQNKDSLDKQTQGYTSLVGILDQLQIPYIDPSSILTVEDYNNPSPVDLHWNNSGHEKVADVLVGCLTGIIENESICEYFTMMED